MKHSSTDLLTMWIEKQCAKPLGSGVYTVHTEKERSGTWVSDQKGQA